MRDYKSSGKRRGGGRAGGSLRPGGSGGPLRMRMWPRRNKSTLPKGFQPLRPPQAVRREREGGEGFQRWHLPLGRMSTRPLRALYLLALLWLLGGTVALLPGLWDRPLEHVRILGREALSEAEVLATAGVRPGMTLLGLDVFAAAERLGAHPRIAAADLRRWFPGTVTVRIAERRPLYSVETAAGTVLLDAEHVVLPVPLDGSQPTGLRRISGVTAPALPGQVLQDPVLARASEVFRALEAQPALAAVQGDAVVDAGDPLRLSLVLPSRRTRLLLPTRGLAEALEAYAALAPHLGAVPGRGLRVLDMRLLFHDGRIVLRGP